MYEEPDTGYNQQEDGRQLVDLESKRNRKFANLYKFKQGNQLVVTVFYLDKNKYT